MVFIRWSLPIFLFFVLSPAFAQQTSGGLDELRESLERQDARIRRMQVLLAEQNARQDGIEQSQPPLDLIESLYAELNQMQEELQNLQPRIKGLEEQLEQQNEGILEARKEPLKVVWRELEVNFSEHPLTFQAQLSQKKAMKEQISERLSENLELTEKSEEASVLEN